MVKYKNLIICLIVVSVILISSLLNFNFVYAASNDKVEAGKSRVLMDYQTGQILSEFNSKEHLPIASVTKLMTLLLTFEAIENGKISLDDEIVASENAAGMGGSQVFIDANATYKVENLLHAIIISSANDASVMLAEEIAGSEEDFVVLMNEKAKSLGANDTNYCNCTGLPSANAYSCANDVALIMKQVLKYPLYFEISKIWMEDFQHPSGRITQMANTNKLLKRYTGCDAGKTGSTNEAGFCMSATAKKNNMRLVAVVLGAESSQARFDTCMTMFDWGFANYSTNCILDKDKDLTTEFSINKAKNEPVIRAKESYYTLNKKGEQTDVSVNYVFDNLSAPLNKGDVVGKVIISQNEIVLAEIDIILANDVEAITYGDSLKDIFKHWALGN